MHKLRLSITVMLGLTTAVFGAATAGAAEIPYKIDIGEAKKLAILAVVPAHLSKYLDEDRLDRDTQFFLFHGYFPAPVNGSFGDWAVNPWTGEVWNLRGCKKVLTPKLRKARDEIRHRFTPEEAQQYLRLSGNKPFCIYGDDD